MPGDIMLSEKYKAFLRHNAPVEFLEGTTAAGKTTVGILKFLFRVAADKSGKASMIAAKTIGKAEQSIIQKDHGIQETFGVLVEYRGAGDKNNKLPHLILHTQDGDRIIYIYGYDDKSRWLGVLGAQFYGAFIDEINTASIDFVQEISMRCDYLMGTLNPDAPDKPVYEQYINHARPLPQYSDDVPDEIRKDLESTTPKDGWTYWFFSFDDNAGLTADKKQQIINAVPEGTKNYKNKILGLRGRATGLVFSNFDPAKHVMSRDEILLRMLTGKIRFKKFTAGLDTSYSQQSEDSIAMVFAGITHDRKIYILSELVYNNKDRDEPLAPSDTAARFVAFLQQCRSSWGYAKDVFVDSADQGTILEIRKRPDSRLFTINNSYKRVEILDRINLQLGWLHTGDYIVCSDCVNHIKELETYSWLEDKDIPEDGHDHTINAAQYAWIPYRAMIGNASELEQK